MTKRASAAKTHGGRNAARQHDRFVESLFIRVLYAKPRVVEGTACATVTFLPRGKAASIARTSGVSPPPLALVTKLTGARRPLLR